MKTPHTSVRRGKRVRVVMKDGLLFIDKFLENTKRFVIFENHEVRKGDIKSFGIYKGQ